MIREYFKMKKNEYRLKAALYGAANSFIAGKEGLAALIEKLFEAPVDTAEDTSAGTVTEK